MDRRPAMAMVVPPPPIPDDARSRHHASRPRSQPAPQRKERETQRATKKRSTNQIRARPADPAIINGILSSFETITPPPVRHFNGHWSDSGSVGSKQSRPYSPGSESAAAPSIARSATTASSGFGLDLSALPDDDDDEEPSDAAPPPSIRTSRPPSGLSQFHAPSPSPINGRYLRPASITSRSSSFSSLTSGKESGARNKHSAESWIKQSSAGQESVRNGRPKEHRKSLRRINSQETLRAPVPDNITLPVGVLDLQALSRAEQIIAKTPPPLTSNKKGRLYLTDSVSSEEKVIRDSILSEQKSSEIEDSPKSSQRSPVSPPTPATEQLTPTPQRLSPRKSPIVDSIPTRTSSLRATSTSPASGKRKDKKSKRQTIANTTAESVAGTTAESIPESSWADLGEEDGTVKRIRELREQRRSRIEESKHLSFLAEVPQLSEDPVPVPPIPQSSARRSEEHKRGASRVRPLANRASTAPPSKAHKILGITDDAPMPSVIGGVHPGIRAESTSPERLRRPYSRKQDGPPVSLLNNRPGTASTPTPPLSLDYSYAQAVDALQGAEREIEKRDKLHHRSPSKNSVTLNALDLPQLQPETSPSQSVRARPKSARKRVEPQSRWTSHHPDLPLEADKRRSRRKSMSDARRTRHFENPSFELERRDSIEDAVLEYLNAPRLSRKVYHPVTRRTIAFSEVGDPNGAVVFICVGMGLTRFVTAFYDELATTLRLRLITVDRPGVGGSDPYPAHDRSGPLSWPDDILAICQQLGITRFSLLAHSAGAIYALATALILPHLINGKVHLLAPWIPPSQLEAISHPTATAPPAGALPRSQRILRVLPTSFLKAANSSFMTATSSSLKPASKRQIQAARERSREQSTSPSPARGPERPPTAHRPDYHRRESMMLMDQFMPTTNPLENFPIPVKEEEEDEDSMFKPQRGSLFLSATATPTDPTFDYAQTALSAAEHAERERKVEYTSRLTQRTWELATRDSNPATDLLVCLERNREIGFKYTDVNRAIVVTHGSEDKRVPVANVKWLADQMNARALSGHLAGHLAGDSVPPTRESWADTLTTGGGCEVRVLEGEGHGLMASAPIMSDILTEIAGYWSGREKGMFATSMMD